MEGPVYTRATRRPWVGMRNSGKQRPPAHQRFIMDELVILDDSLYPRGSISRAIRVIFSCNGCEAVVLGCTEIPAADSTRRFRAPILDSTRRSPVLRYVKRQVRAATS